jgi:2'-5' RNA ligase
VPVLFAKLVIEEPARDWIEHIRRVHDPQHAFVEPHFTLVFPFDGIPVEQIVPHVSSVITATPAINFGLRRVSAVPDPFGPRSYLFLLPEGGKDALHRVHDELYSGVLAAKLHGSVPFLPHVTVGAFDSHHEAERAARSLGPVNIEGQLDHVELAEFNGAAVREIRTFEFGEAV